MLTLLVPRSVGWERGLIQPPTKAVHPPSDWEPTIRCRPDPGPWLVVRSSRAKSVQADPGDVLEQFLQMKPSETGVLAFAQSFGILGLNEILIDPATTPSAAEVGESFGSWVRERSALWFARGLFGWLRDPDIDAARRAQQAHKPGGRGGLSVCFDSSGRPFRPLRLPDSRIAAVFSCDARTAPVWRQDPLQPAREKLAELVSSRIRDVRYSLTVAKDSFTLEPQAPRLASALWLELAQRVATLRRLPCAACPWWFSPQRSSATCCSVKCANRLRQRAYRRRQNKT